MIDLTKYLLECDSVRTKFMQKNSQNDRERLINDFVDYLYEEGLSKDQIEEILNCESFLEAQGNSQMITNNKSYKEAVAKALGK
ncbi:hypothetical protein [Clostridium botulinum]|uniref:hypothetical protein n=1 Tax=Clostridium botulinum TaxID=1491 RepID=UPI001C9A7808|nr:hypothetical protein [Clostridium botulinum]MBY6809090.1 hypothetical protein [Clostridium botulinum]MBY6822205.1 hypothetical protein [Clostridium botulinum]MBY6833005.1 hypothetical protein [Clostridium botulinum]MBY6972233.1 hypothetical protein [Clostridium botulinum]MCS6103507.1 hypothetical protein [Clostridium botulinum]